MGSAVTILFRLAVGFFLVLNSAQGAVSIVPDIPHRESVSVLGYSPDGQLIASAGYDGTINLRDAETGLLFRTLYGSTRAIHSFVFTNSGNKLISIDGERENYIRTWDTKTGLLINSSEIDYHGYKSAFSADGKFLAMVTDPECAFFRSCEEADAIAANEEEKGWIEIIDVTTLQLKIRIDNINLGIGAVAFATNRELIAGLSSGAIRNYDLDNGETLIELPAHSGPISSLSVTNDGKWVASASDDFTVKLWNRSNGLEQTLYALETSITAVAVSPGNKYIAVSSEDGVTRIWSISSGSQHQQWRAKNPNALPMKLAFSADGRHLAGGGLYGAVQIYQIANPDNSQASPGIFHPAVKAIVSPNQQRLAVLDMAGNIALWNLVDGSLISTLDINSDGRNLRAFDNSLLDIAFSEDSKTLGSVSNLSVRYWNSITGELISNTERNLKTTFMHSRIYYRNGGFIVVTFSDNSCSQNVYAGTCGGIISLTNSLKPNSIQEIELPGRVFGIYDLSPRGDQILVKRSGLDLLHIPSGKRVIQDLDMHGDYKTVSNYATAATFSPDGQQLITGHLNGEVRKWNVRTGDLLHNDLDRSSIIRKLSISRDGKKLAVLNRHGRLQIKDTLTGSNLLEIKTPHQFIRFLDISADGSRLFATGIDSIVKLYELENRELDSIFYSDSSGEWFSMLTSGFFNSSPKGAGSINVVRDFESVGVGQLYQSMYRPDLVFEALDGDPEGLISRAANEINLDALFDSGLPPGISLDPTNQTSVSQRNFLVNALLTNRGGGWGRIEWRSNGTTVGVQTLEPGGEENTLIEQELELELGDNLIELVVYNSANLIASKPAALTINWDGVEKIEVPTLHVVVVGVDAYQDRSLRLNFAVSDATSIATTLEAASAELYSNVVVHYALDESATAPELDKLFTRMAKTIRKNDVFIFFLAGHGKTVDGKYYFIPQDFDYKNEESIVRNGINQDLWQSWFAQIPARKSLLMYDTCESGSLTESRSEQRDIERVTALDKLTHATGRAVLSATTDDSPAYEGYHGHGVFTFGILDALESADSNSDDLIEVNELVSYIDHVVPKISFETFGFRQIPQMRVVGSNFPISRKYQPINGNTE